MTNHESAILFEKGFLLGAPLPEIILAAIGIWNMQNDYPIDEPTWNLLISSNGFTFPIAVLVSLILGFTPISNYLAELLLIVIGTTGLFFFGDQFNGPIFFLAFVMFALKAFVLSGLLTLARKMIAIRLR
ncbi:hypothetical protein CKALI_09670 [Corynebacterium kalinowskii]|uniref:Uncharacterized protein n=1 Tax=Corynebacterium kalinowskii TaxID=2675216 RepID=A0A6B8VID9_9CORY|nr:hypothetical protein [Corynebacterium kalinowskii]QGU02789.1 hypothetical protein CKALI_09670 [Corynebacterium kalinowskii]